MYEYDIQLHGVQCVWLWFVMLPVLGKILHQKMNICKRQSGIQNNLTPARSEDLWDEVYQDVEIVSKMWKVEFGGTKLWKVDS